MEFSAIEIPVTTWDNCYGQPMAQHVKNFFFNSAILLHCFFPLKKPRRILNGYNQQCYYVGNLVVPVGKTSAQKR